MKKISTYWYLRAIKQLHSDAPENMLCNYWVP